MSLSRKIRQCPVCRNAAVGTIIRHGFYKTNWGKRRRYRCRTCGQTFCSTTWYIADNTLLPLAA